MQLVFIVISFMYITKEAILRACTYFLLPLAELIDY